MNRSAILSALTLTLTAGAASAGTVAHWTFDSRNDFNAGIATDVSGNGNTLSLTSVGNPGVENQATFSTSTFNTPYANTGAVRFNGTRNGANGHTGSYFQTDANAPINSMRFENGYTVEVMFQVAAPYSPENNRWMGMLGRTGVANGDSPATFAISNLGEVQWHSQETDGQDSPGRSQSAWSPALVTPGSPAESPYFHAAAVNYLGEDNNWHVDLYINGFLGSRNIINADHNGLHAFEGGRFVVGTGIYDGLADSPFNGLIDDIRISDTALTPDQFTMSVPTPGAAGLLGLAGLAATRRRR